MKKILNYILLIVIIMTYFIPVNYMPVLADNTYTVSVIKTDSTTEVIGTYSNYDEAKIVMNNYASDANRVAVIYRDNKIINARYAVATLLGSSPISLYSNVNDSSEYTSTHPDYGKEAAFIDYDPNTNRVKIMISGFTGWTSLDNVNITPITEFGGKAVKVSDKTSGSINIRSDHSTSCSIIGAATAGSIHRYYDKYYDGTYTWYKIYYNNNYGWIASKDGWTEETNISSIQTYYQHYSSGNLIHYFKYSSGQSYTNLGPSPSYLTKSVNYFSFDGNYFYSSLTTMLDDYRNNTRDNAVNTNPWYPYYLYLPNHTKTGYTADDFNQIIINKGYNSKSESVMYGEGENFILSQETYGVNALLTFSAAINESATGTSTIAKDKNNLFGHGAYDSCPYTCATTYATVKDSIMAHASMAGTGYSSPSDWRYFGSHYGNKASGMNVKYATDPYWGEKAAMNSYLSDLSFGRQDYLSNTVAIKTSFEDVPVKKSPTDSSDTIYTLKNKYSSVSNIPVVVTERVYNDGTYWYKVYSDTALDENQNIASVNYNFNSSYGYIKADYLYVNNSEPVINANDISVEYGSNFDILSSVTANDAEDGDITSLITYVGSVDTSKPGEYEITYSVEDYSRFKTNKTITVTVLNPKEPILEAQDKTLVQYTEFDLLENVKASDYIDGDLTAQIEIISSNINIDKIGEYEVIYKVTNSNQKSVEKKIRVTVIKNEEPTIEVDDVEISLYSDFKALDIVKAYDKEDGDITDNITIIENNVNTNEIGEYKVTYQVSDKASQMVTKTICVKVQKKALEEKSANFHFEYLKEIDGKLELKGYNTINGIDNNLDQNIIYEIIFENIDTEKETTFTANRITDKSEMTRPVYSNDGKDYTYSWFKFEFDFSNISDGNYRIYVVAKTSDFYSKSVINNKLYKEQATSYNDEKYVLIQNNYNDKTAPIEFTIRSKELAKKNSSYIYNQYDTYRTFTFTDDNLLHLKGVSYSFGADLSKDKKVERKILFENIETYETYEFDLGSTTDGLYSVVLPVSDNLSKERAWYDSKIDISNLPKGNYVIYITTKSNITDIAEFTEKLNRSLDNVTTTINGKKYSFSINYDRGNRIELKVE